MKADQKFVSLLTNQQLQTRMILNKVTIAPYLTPTPNKDLPSPKEPQTAPRLLSLNKKVHIGNQFVLTTSKEKQILHFDDSICFTELNRNNTKDLRIKEKSNKKCVSQILTIKNIYQSPKTQRKVPGLEQIAIKNSQTTMDSSYQLGLLCEWNHTTERNQSNRHHSSYSTRKKSWNKQIQQSPLAQGTINNPVLFRKKSILASNRPHYNGPNIPENNSYGNISSEQSNINLRIASSDKRRDKTKKNNFLQYSILSIKPQEIKAFVVKRQQEKEMMEQRRKQQKGVQAQMLQQLRKKEEILRRHALLQERLREQLAKDKQIEFRGKIYTREASRKNMFIQQNNELNPWEVEPGMQGSSILIDIL